MAQLSRKLRGSSKASAAGKPATAGKGRRK